MADKYSDYTRAQAEKIVGMMEKGTDPWTRPWAPSDYPQAAPHNASTGKAYTGFNSVVLTTEEIITGYSDPRWLTFNQAKSLGASVRKGEKATQLVKWLERKDKEDAKAKAESAEAVKAPMIPILFSVFNADQMKDMPKAPLREAITEQVRHERCEALIRDTGATIVLGGDSAHYNPRTDRIHMPLPEQFANWDAWASVCLHELGHWTGAASRLNRQFGRRGDETYALEELRAEIASWQIAQRLGVGHDPSNHVAYIAGWIKAIREDPKTLINACRDSEKICDYIGVHKYEYEATKANEATNEAVVVNIADRAKQAPVHQQEPEYEQAMGFSR